MYDGVVVTTTPALSVDTMTTVVLNVDAGKGSGLLVVDWITVTVPP